MSLPEDHGVIQLTKLLRAIDGKTVNLTAVRETKAEFDRRVRESIDRTHRRALIAGS